MVGRLTVLGLLLLAGSAPASAERFVLAWPPTFYDSAELIIHGGPGSPAEPVLVSVRARGFSADDWLPAGGVLRVPLPVGARCSSGVEDCGIVVEAAASDLRVTLQSPDTRGVPDTLARTAHDTVRIPSAEEAGRSFALLSAPNSPDFPAALSYASIVAVEGATVSASSPCLGVVDGRLEADQVLTLSCAGAGEDLTGTRLESDGSVIVLSGNRSAPLPVVAGSGWSADLLLDASPALEPLASGSTWLVPPLPRRASHEGLGDLVSCAAGAALSVRIRDDSGRDETRSLAVGERLELDSAAPGGDALLRLDADGPLACRQLSKSRAHRGSGDGAAVPLVPRELFTLADRAFLPDGYGEGSHLVVVCEAGATVNLDGVALGGFLPAPGGDLAWSVVALAAPPTGEGRLIELSADAPFGAWFFGQGGYKAHGLAVARSRPRPPPAVVSRGTEPDALAALAEVAGSRWCDGEVGELFFYEIVGDFGLRLTREAGSTCLSWSAPGGG